MELKSYQRAFLRSQAHDLDPVVYVGKDGFKKSVVDALNLALDCHELVKVRFSNNKDEVKEISYQLADATDSYLVGTIGFTAIFFKQDPDNPERIYKI